MNKYIFKITIPLLLLAVALYFLIGFFASKLLSDPQTCDEFKSQEDAQQALEKHPGLDGDKDGTACDALLKPTPRPRAAATPSTPPTPSTQTTPPQKQQVEVLIKQSNPPSEDADDPTPAPEPTPTPAPQPSPAPEPPTPTPECAVNILGIRVCSN